MVTSSPELWVDGEVVADCAVVPFMPRAPPLRIPVAVSLSAKEISSVPTLISPEVGKAVESARVIDVVLTSAMLAPKVVVAAPEADPDQVPVPHP